jgi:hypothetical protein
VNPEWMSHDRIGSPGEPKIGVRNQTSQILVFHKVAWGFYLEHELPSAIYTSAWYSIKSGSLMVKEPTAVIQ